MSAPGWRAVVLSAILPVAALAADPIPDDAALEAARAVIGEIEIDAQDIFNLDDPEENHWAFRAANFLHVSTRPAVIRNLLLFRSGDPYVGRLLRESERILRGQRYLYDAWIEPTRYENGRVDLRVRTRDVWTLTPGISFSRAGGENLWRIGIEESNLFGTGKEITVRREENLDRTQVLYRYRDPGVAGSRVVLHAQYADNSDGYGRLLAVARPFYAQDVRWAVAARAFDDESTVSLYDRGEIFASFAQATRFLDAWYGLGGRGATGTVLRWKLGYTFEEKRFGPDPSGGLPPPDGIPPDRTLAFPWFGIETFQDRFVEVTDLDQIVRTEDLYLGSRLDARLGVSDPAFGAEGPTRLVFEAAWRGGTPFDGNRYLLGRAAVSGRYGSGLTENFVVGSAGRAFLRHGRGWAFVAEASAEVSRRLDPEFQIVLGGDTGLRGYPVRYARGDRRWLVTLEERWYADAELLKLFHIGAAIFVDLGRAWFESGEPEDLGVLKDVGVGLRLASSRSAQGAMLHVDVAVPLDGEPDIRDVQIVVRGRDRF